MIFDWELRPGTTRVLLVRHGEPDPSVRGRCYGRLDMDLSETGRAQANQLAVGLGHAPIAAIYSSPSRRALDTARPLAKTHGLELRTHDGFRELDFGLLEGLSYDEIAARHPELYRGWMTHPTQLEFPGGESWTALNRRTLTAQHALVVEHAGTTVAVVAHGGPIRALVAAALALSPEHVFRLDPGLASVSILDYVHEAAIVRMFSAPP